MASNQLTANTKATLHARYKKGHWRRWINNPFMLERYIARIMNIKNNHVGAERTFQRWVTWLNRALNFDHGFSLSDEQLKIGYVLYDQLFSRSGKRPYVVSRKQRDFFIFCANLIATGQKRPLRISLYRNDWSKQWYSIAGYFIVEGVIPALEKANLIIVKRGNEVVHRVARIWPTEAFLKHFIGSGDIKRKPLDLVILHDKGKRTINYDDTPEIVRIRSILLIANAVNRLFKVTLTDEEGLVTYFETDLHAVFNENFERGGRLYTAGVGYQNGLKSKKRLLIRIGGKQTVELDFAALHPRLLYALKKIQYKGDPYAAVDDDPKMRSILKKVFLSLLNAEDEKTAVSSGNLKLINNRRAQYLLRRNDTSIKKITALFKKTALRRLKWISRYWPVGPQSGKSS